MRIKLKGIFKVKDGYFDEYEFREFVKKRGISPFEYEEFKLSIAIKVGKRWKLKKRIVRARMEYPPCSCCEPYKKFEIVY